MVNGIIGRKLGMTQLFAEDGTVTPVTIIKAGPCVVVQTKSAAGKDGYNAVQLGLVEEKPIRVKNVTKPLRGHFEKTGGGVPPTRVLKEIRLSSEPEATIGDQVKVDVFTDGDKIDLTAFAGLADFKSFKTLAASGRMEDVGNGVLIHLDPNYGYSTDNTVLVVGVGLADLTSVCFIF